MSPLDTRSTIEHPPAPAGREKAADARLATVTDAVPPTLGVPFVSPLFTAVGAYPEYLAAAWELALPTLASTAFEEAADRVRACVPADVIPDAATLPGTPHDRSALMSYVDTHHWLLPKLLLLATSWHDGLTGQPGYRYAIRAEEVTADAAARPADPGSVWGIHPAAVAAATVPQVEGSPVEAVLDELRSRHGHPRVLSPYRGLVPWPEQVVAAWRTMDGMVGSPPYAAAAERLLEVAAAEARILPVVGPERSAELVRSTEDLQQLTGVLWQFRRELIPALLLDFTCLQGVLRGRAAATRGHLSRGRTTTG